jgi:hypothetical protein
MADVPTKKVVVFEAKYPGLEMHGKEVKDEDNVRSLQHFVKFRPGPLLRGMGHTDQRGYYGTDDEAVIAWLRKHKSFGKTFTEMEAGKVPQFMQPKAPAATPPKAA